MTHRWSWLPLAAAVALSCWLTAPATALPKNVEQSADGTCYNVVTKQKVDCATGDVLVTSNPLDRDLWRLYPNIINNQLCAAVTGGNTQVDSSAVLDTHDMKRLALIFYVQQDSASLSVPQRWAVEVRAHYNTSGDSASAYPWYRLRTPPSAASAAPIDTSTVGQFAVGTGTGTGVPWSGEFVVVTNYNREGAVTAGTGGYPKGLYIPLYDESGAPYWGPYTSVRVRLLSGVKVRATVRVDMVGSAL